MSVINAFVGTMVIEFSFKCLRTTIRQSLAISIYSRLSADQAYNTVVVMGILTQLIAVRLSEFHSIVAPAELDGPVPLHAIS